MSEESKAIAKWLRDAADTARARDDGFKGRITSDNFDTVATMIERGVYIDLGYYTPKHDISDNEA